MNRHDETDQRIRTWLHEEAQGELPDRALRETFATTRSTTQQRGLRGRMRSRRDRLHRTTRRRNDMLALATVSASAAAVILAVSVFVVEEPAPVPGAEAPVISVEEQMFRGSFSYGPPCTDGTGGEEIDDCWQQVGVSFDDPRFQGTVEMRANADYTDQGIYRNQFIITTEEGAWVGDPVPGILTRPDTGVPSVHLFTGEGAYEGLQAVAAVVLSGGGFGVEGYVVHGGFPELSGD